jgi:hypothetical protein
MAAECHSVNDKTKIEADNVVLYYEKKTWRILILVIAEGKMDTSKGKDGAYKWSINDSKRAEHELLGYCVEYMEGKNSGEFPYVYGLTYLNCLWRFCSFEHGTREKYYYDIGKDSDAKILERQFNTICAKLPQPVQRKQQQPQSYQQQPQSYQQQS